MVTATVQNLNSYFFVIFYALVINNLHILLEVVVAFLCHLRTVKLKSVSYLYISYVIVGPAGRRSPYTAFKLKGHCKTYDDKQICTMYKTITIKKK